VTVTISGTTVTAKGSVGTLTRSFSPAVKIEQKENAISVAPSNNALTTKMMVGTSVAHLKNMLRGSQEAFSKKLIVEGIGFKADVKGKEMTLSLGFSHPVKVAIPENVKVTAEKGVISVSGPDIEAVGAFAARVRALKKPEPYKGKGIRYEKEVVRRKQGKKTT
jgi:large subunit ribosomal protein L6